MDHIFKQKFSSTMETGNHFKNGAGSKNQMSRRNILKMNLFKFTASLTLLVMFSGYAQAQLNIGARAGVNYTNMLFLVSGAGSISTQMQPGFQAGVVTERTENGKGSQVGLLIVSQKCKFDNGSWMGFSNETLNMTYLRMPANFLRKKDLSGTQLLLQAGASLGYAVSGKITGEQRGEKVEEKIEFGKDGMSRFEMGVSLGIGLQFSNIQTVLEYNLSNNFGKNNGATMLNNGFALNATYFFNK